MRSEAKRLTQLSNILTVLPMPKKKGKLANMKLQQSLLGKICFDWTKIERPLKIQVVAAFMFQGVQPHLCFRVIQYAACIFKGGFKLQEIRLRSPLFRCPVGISQEFRPFSVETLRGFQDQPRCRFELTWDDGSKRRPIYFIPLGS